MVQQLVTRERWSRFIVVLGIAKAGMHEAKLKKHEGALEGRFRPARSTSIITIARRWTLGLSTLLDSHFSPLALDGATATLRPQGGIQPWKSFQCSTPERLLLWTKGTIPAQAAD
ncbi:hypothetical protein B0T13DRAFT_451561 [Neurospora crassa]|nr:hypothetical protein B0T13DRAFT_451561 [Neurospora crassa]